MTIQLDKPTKGCIVSMPETCSKNDVGVFRIRSNDTRVNNNVLVALRATAFGERNAARDIVNDIGIGFGVGPLHSRVDEARNIIRQQLSNLEPGRTLIVTGDSAGAALTQHLAHDPEFAKCNNIKFIRFQTPVVFNNANHSPNFTSFMNRGDIIAGGTAPGDNIPVEGNISNAHDLANHLTDEAMLALVPEIREEIQHFNLSDAVSCVDSFITLVGGKRSKPVQLGLSIARNIANGDLHQMNSVPGIMGLISTAAIAFNSPELERVVGIYKTVDLAQQLCRHMINPPTTITGGVNVAVILANLLPSGSIDPKVRACISCVAKAIALQKAIAAFATGGPYGAVAAAIKQMIDTCNEDDDDDGEGGGGNGQGDGTSKGDSNMGNDEKVIAIHMASL
jgi:hypothetical protein